MLHDSSCCCVSSGNGLLIELHGLTVSVTEVACRPLVHLRKQLKRLLASPEGSFGSLYCLPCFLTGTGRVMAVNKFAGLAGAILSRMAQPSQ